MDVSLSRAVDHPTEGYFLLRMVAGGWQVPARIWQDEAGIWRAEIDGQTQEPGAADWTQAAGVSRVWHYGRRVIESEYRHRLTIRAWAVKHNPSHPAANPMTPINLRNMPPAF